MPLLTEHEASQPVVAKITKLFNEQMQRYREQNDHPNADPLLRGRIAELKTLTKILNSRG